ncbi:unnamed protein product [Caenorhabditis bovis]|uniref:Uncharacterized protein n=1 Tax=Caenorhabditis bovis TaxID=2654633 RepID=A0A8S1EPA4_9PELO|nr:unnamed protein product [Caenorhabditis bovis]
MKPFLLILTIHALFKRALTQQPTYTCPNNANPLIANSGTNLFCTSVGSTSDCPTSSSCVQSANMPSILICCSSASSVTPVCPNNAVAQTSAEGYVACNINNPICNSGYQCVQSMNVPSLSICCSTSSQTTMCPTDFTPVIDTNGLTITCSPSSSNCPSESSCMQSTFNSAFICCRSSTSTRICPNQQNALITNNNLEMCTTPGTQCSQIGYTCQFSSLLGAYVCCGNGAIDNGVPKCADNRPTYQQIVGETYTCDSNARCPSGYDCAPSDDPFIDVCCLTGATPIPENIACPDGWNPYRNEVDNSVRTCDAVQDTSCPVGFSCAPSSRPSQFLCCRLASALVCINGRTLLINGSPKLCRPSPISQCPYNYSCQQSINPTVTVCCSDT